MNEKQDFVANEHSSHLWKRLATVLVFLYLGAMIIMFLADLKTVFEPSLLLPIMNTIFAGLIPIAVSIIAARAYLFSGLNSLLFMGCGMMTFGCAAILAGWLISGQQGPNVNVTIYNTGALLGAVFHLFGIVFTFRNVIPDAMPEQRKFKLIAIYSGMIILIFFLTLATFWGMTPPFFIQGVGPTLLRQIVLGTAVLLFLLSALVIMGSFIKKKLDFHYWYSLSLIMIAFGLIAFFIQKSVGSPLGWLGRSGQYIGGIYALIAILITLKSARIKGLSVPSAVADLFSDAELNYRVLVETITDAVVYFEQDGKIIQWNQAAEKVFGYRQSEAVGSSIFKLVISDTFLEIFHKELNNLNAIDDRRKVGRLLEISVKTKTGGVIPVETSISAMKARDQWSFVCVVRDITERKNAEAAIRELNENLEKKVEERSQALRESQDKILLLMNSTAEAIYGIDMNGNCTFCNNSCLHLLGYNHPDELLGKNMHWQIHSKHPDGTHFPIEECRIFQAFYKGEGTHVDDEVLWRSDGTSFPAEYWSYPQRRDGVVVGAVVTFLDITERKQAEEAVRIERNFIANIMETSPVGIVTVDSMGRISFANYKAVATLGLSKDRVSQTNYNAPMWHISDLDGKPFPDDRLPFNIVMSTGKSVFDVQHAIQLPDGKQILLSINGAPIIDANHQVTGMVASIDDITEHKKNEENYRTLFREMLDGFALHEIICDREGLPVDYRFLAVNPAFERITGLKAKELEGHTVLEVLPNTESHWIETYGKVALTGEPAFFESYAGEMEKHFEVTAFRPAPNQFAVIFQDITERKRALEEKEKLEAQLFQSQKMEAIGTLAGGIAHDFNNILAVIIGYTELARDRNQKENKEKYLQETLNGAQRAKNLVKQILTFSRQDGNEKKPLDIKILLKEAVKFLRASIPTTVEIDQQLTEEECNIMADPTQMHQVIMNLCTNASHAMKETGGTLNIELANIEMHEGDLPSHPELKPGYYVKLTVSDTGYGIDPAIVQRVFEPFFTTKSVDEGTGLGLSVVYGIVKGHGGVINVYSEQGKGATFNIYLPRITQTEAMDEDAGKPVIGGTERILFVDDEPLLVDIGMRMLTSLGYDATGATSSIEALDMFRAEPQRFDLVITDMTLPIMTGIDLSRDILKINQDILIILCSGIKDPGTEAKAKSLGIKAYLIKPLTRRELAGVMREILDGKK